MNEYNRTDHPYSTRRSHYQPLGTRETFSFATRATSANYPVGSQRGFQSRYCPSFGYFPANRSMMARTFFSAPLSWFRERRSSSGTDSKDSAQESYRHRQCHSADNASERDTLEYPQYGQSTESQQCDHPTYLERTQYKTSFVQNIQTQPRQTVRRETLRYSWALYESAGQVDCLLCGRKKSDPSTRTDATITAYATRYSCQTNSRLYTSWHHHVICSLKHARGHSARRLHAPPSTSGIYQIPADYRHKNSAGFGSSSDSGQLWNTQTSQSSIMAQTTSSFSIAFYAHIQFLGKLGGALVL